MPCRLLYQTCKCIADFCGSSARALFEFLRSVIRTSSSSQDKERAKIQLFKLLILPYVCTVNALEGIVEGIGVVKKSANPFKKAVKQVKLNLDADQIGGVKNHIHTHTNGLQLALQMTNL